MAGMLPGVESARWRRFHQSGVLSDFSTIAASNYTRRSFCLYSTKHESLIPSSSLLEKSVSYYARPDDELDDAVREAKERLDERLRAQKKSSKQRQNSKEKKKYNEGKPKGLAELQLEVYGSKRNASRMFNWSKMSWKASDLENCAVCLDSFRVCLGTRREREEQKIN